MKHCRNSSIASSAGVGATGRERWMQREFSALSGKLAKHPLPEAVSSGQHMAKVKEKKKRQEYFKNPEDSPRARQSQHTHTQKKSRYIRGGVFNCSFSIGFVPKMFL